MLKKLLVYKLRKLQASKNLSDVDFANLLFTSGYRRRENFFGLMDENSRDTLNDYTSYCQFDVLQNYFQLSEEQVEDLRICNDMSDLSVQNIKNFNISLDQQKIIYILIQNTLKEAYIEDILFKLKVLGFNAD